MASTSGHLTQSRFYSTAFNAAVFDGPIRLYFAQAQEGVALQIYFRLQQHFKEAYATFRRSHKRHGRTLFLMLYPSHAEFATAFGSAPGPVVSDYLGDDFVIGVNGPLGDENYGAVFARVEVILRSLGVTTTETPSPSI